MILEPAFATDDISRNEFVFGFGEVENSLDKAENGTEATGNNCDDNLDNSFLGIAEVEFVNTKATK